MKEDFIKGLILALSDDSVIAKLNDTFCQHLKFDLKKVTDASKCVQAEMKKLKETSTQLSREVSELRKLVLNKDEEIADLKKKVVDLELDTDRQSQFSRRNSIRLVGLKENENEKLSERVIGLANKKMGIEPPLTEEDIERIHRTGPIMPGKSRGVLVKFSSYKTKQRVYAQRKSLLVKEGAQSAHKPDSIFINEDLTRRRAALFWDCRKLLKDKKINGCWTHDGNIVMLDRRNKVHTINSKADLLKKSND